MISYDIATNPDIADETALVLDVDTQTVNIAQRDESGTHVVMLTGAMFVQFLTLVHSHVGPNGNIMLDPKDTPLYGVQ